jgi:hypothetical protein
VSYILIKSVELNILFSLVIWLILFLNSNLNYSKAFINAVSPLVAILFVAFISSFFYSSTIYDYIKDFFYLLKPIIYLFIGYLIVKKINDKDYIFKIIIYSAFIFALAHILKTIFFLMYEPFNINQLRNENGLGNYLEMIALVFLLNSRFQSFVSFKIKWLNMFKLIIILSFLLYFSRTMFFSLILLLLSVKGYLKISKKGVTYISIFILIISLFYWYLFSINIERDEQGIFGFLYKLKIAPSEIFSPNIDINNHANLWDHWRAYEASKAIEQLFNTKYGIGLISGKGLGGLVDLGFVAPLNKEGMRYISSLHNGYAFIIYKSGIIGLIFYLLFLLYLYMISYQKGLNEKQIFLNNLISGFAVYYTFTTLIISGIYNYGEVMAIILGSLIYLSRFYSKKEI